MVNGILEVRGGDSHLMGLSLLLLTLALGAHVMAHRLEKLETWYLENDTLSPVAEGLGMACIILLLTLATPFEQQRFIYFQFWNRPEP